MPRPKSLPMPENPKAAVEFTPERRRIFLNNLRETGFQTLSAEVAGVVPRTVQRHRTEDKVFAAEYQEALDYHTENVITRALVARGVDGFKRPVIGGKDRDEVVAYEQVYSDTCLTMLARSRKTEYNKGAGEGGDGPGGAGGGGGGGVLIVGQAPHTLDDWERLFSAKAKGHTGRPEGA